MYGLQKVTGLRGRPRNVLLSIVARRHRYKHRHSHRDIGIEMIVLEVIPIERTFEDSPQTYRGIVHAIL